MPQFNEGWEEEELRIDPPPPPGTITKKTEPTVIYKKNGINSTTHFIKCSASRFYNLLLFTNTQKIKGKYYTNQNAWIEIIQSEGRSPGKPIN